MILSPAAWTRRLAVALGAAWAVTVGLVAWWLASTPGAALQQQLAQVQPRALGLLFALFVGLSIVQLPRAFRQLGASRGVLLAVTAVSLLAVGLTAGVAPRTSRILFDEQIYADVGHNMADLGLAQMCDEGAAESGRLSCLRGEYNKEPDGFAFLLSLLYRPFGANERTASLFNNAIDGLLVWVVFLIAGLLLGDPVAGAWGALIAALIPQQLLWSNTAAAEPSAAFFCAVAIMTAAAFVRRPTTGGLWWVVAATAAAVQFRPESILCAPAVFLVVALLAPDELRAPRMWIAALGGAVLCSTLVAHMVAVAGNPWDAPGARFSLDYIRGNAATNARFYLLDHRFPGLFFILALIGAGWHSSAPGARVAAAVYFLLFWGVFIAYYAGSYDYGANVRYSLMTYPPLAVLAGAGVAMLTRAVAARSGARESVTAAAVAALLILQFGPYVRLVSEVGDEGWAARADLAFAREAAASLPRNSMVLTHDPSMFLTWGRNAAQTYLAAQDPGYARHVLVPRFPGGVYLHWGYWCNASVPVQQAFCTQVLAQFPRHSLVREQTDRNYRFALYRLDP